MSTSIQVVTPARIPCYLEGARPPAGTSVLKGVIGIFSEPLCWPPPLALATGSVWGWWHFLVMKCRFEGRTSPPTASGYMETGRYLDVGP